MEEPIRKSVEKWKTECLVVMSKNVGEHPEMKPPLRTDALGGESEEFFAQLLF